MAYWLLKTEPEEYGFVDLEREGRGTWDGVCNAQAQRNLRSMVPGDRALIYHSGRERSAVGLARVVSDPGPDPVDPALVAVDVVPEGRLPQPVTLAVLKAAPDFAGSPLVRQGRLSVVPLTERQWRRILSLAGSEA